MAYLDDITQQEYYESNNLGNYQFTSLKDIIGYFMLVYVGDNKIISDISRTEVAFHAQRAMQELSFDTFKSCKSQEITLSPSLTMMLPQDYVNYTKLSWIDSSGIKHLLYPTSKTSNPFPVKQDANDDYLFNQDGMLESSTNLISNGDFNNDTGWTITNTTGTSWVIGDYTHVDAGGVGIDHTYKNVLYGNSAAVGYIEIEAPDIIEGRRYKITYDVVIGSTAGGSLILANHTTNQSTLNSQINDNNVDLVNVTSTGTHYVEWVQGSINTGKIKLWNNTLFDGVVDNIKVVRVSEGEDSVSWQNYKATTPAENNNDDYEDDTYWPFDGRRYGLSPEHAQVNGSFYIDCKAGRIHFSSNLSGETIVLDYISDGIGSEEEMQVHKFAEEAMYKSILYAILSNRSNIAANQVARFKKERFAAIRQAKLRLSNIKLEEITQILRGKSKQIKH
jgi:hypothetical protein